MRNIEILEKAVKKAVKNGWINPDGIDYSIYRYDSSCGNGCTFYLEDMEYGELFGRIIFSHYFAKAFWGEVMLIPIKHDNKIATAIDVAQLPHGITLKDFMNELKIHGEIKLTEKMSNWQYHLQQMVLEEDPIKYLEKFLDE